MKTENMTTLPITLIVKAPNQLIEDQTIKCESTWSVKILKEHLSQVYPNKPPENEQKLIYSGHLLNDHVILKDVLREYGGPKRIHTLHLVCTPEYTKNLQQTQSVPRTNENAMVENVNENPPSPIMNNPGRNNTAYERFPDLNMYNNSHYSLHQFMMIQQTYLQYMQHYMNVAHLQRFGVPMPGLPDHNTISEYDNNRQQDPGAVRQRNNAGGDGVLGNAEQWGGNMGVAPFNNGVGNVAAVQQPQQFGVMDQNAGAAVDPPAAVPAAQAQPLRGIGLNDDRDHRDWLDHFYMVCRIMIFISIVYFYSSATRFFVVFFTAICLYLYQIGFFRNVNLNNNDINANERRPGEGVLAAGVGVLRAPHAAFAAGTDGTDEAYTPLHEREPSRLTVAWTFFTAFLASLLPEIPNVV